MCEPNFGRSLFLYLFQCEIFLVSTVRCPKSLDKFIFWVA